MYNVYSLLPGVSKRSIKFTDSRSANDFCTRLNRLIHSDGLEHRYMAAYIKVTGNDNNIDAPIDNNTYFLVTEFNPIKYKLVASFLCPFDAVMYCDNNENYSYTFSPLEVTSFIIVSE